MKPVSNSSFANLILLATISTSVISLPYESKDSLLTNHEVNYNHMKSIAEWKDSAFNALPDYSTQKEDESKIQTIIGFSHKVLSESTDIDSEFVDIVNDNFWDLV